MLPGSIKSKRRVCILQVDVLPYALIITKHIEGSTNRRKEDDLVVGEVGDDQSNNTVGKNMQGACAILPAV